MLLFIADWTTLNFVVSRIKTKIANIVRLFVILALFNAQLEQPLTSAKGRDV